MLSLFIQLVMISVSALIIFILVKPPAYVIQEQRIKKKYTLKLVKHKEGKYLNNKLPVQLQQRQVI